MTDVAATIPSPAWVEIDLDAIRQNYRTVHALLAPGVIHYCVVKADAYGHDASRVAAALTLEGARHFAVARVQEALQVLEAAPKATVLIFTPPDETTAAAIAASGASVSVCHQSHIEALSAAARAQGTTVGVHLEVDIGMGRLGVRPDNAVSYAQKISTTPGLRLEGVMAHFPSADTPPHDLTLQQLSIFAETRTALENAGFRDILYHCANSAATLDYPDSHHSAVRTGIVLYGQYPSAHVARRIPLVPAMAFFSRIIMLKRVLPGAGISYGHTFVTKRPSLIATLPLGYADGYPRHASNKAVALVNGYAAPVAGRVCMDQMMLDVTDVPQVEVGSEVLLWGRSNRFVLPADAVAATFGSLGYELTTRIGRRVPRLFSTDARK